MEKASRKELIAQYKDREKIGGIFSIRCEGSGNIWVKSASDLESAKKRFDFSILTKLCPQPSMGDDWKKYGLDSFKFEVIEEIKKKETQTDREFTKVIEDLQELWEEKLGGRK